jgi:BMFP domain-containing protein YqiC
MAYEGERLFDGFGRLINDAVGLADNVRREIDAVVRQQAERILGDLDMVQREEFEAVREMAAVARAENERLAARVAVLEQKLGIATPDVAAGSDPDASSTAL